MALTVVIPYREGRKHLTQLLATLPAEFTSVIVVDDVSAEPPLATPRPGVRFYRLQERGYFAGAVNEGIRLAGGDDVLVLNQDVYFAGNDWLPEFERLRQEYAMLGEGVFSHPAWPNGYIQGTFMYISRAALERVGMLDAEFYPLWGGTCELQLRICRAGLPVKPLRDMTWFAHGRHQVLQFTGRGINPDWPVLCGDAIAQELQRDEADLLKLLATPPTLSVIVACYNYGRFLPDCLNSLLGGQTVRGVVPAQSFQGFEVVIVDDASTDDTLTIGQGLADSWRGVRYIRLSQNVGTAEAYNAGIRASYGRYVTMLSADDMREPWALRAMLRLCVANAHSFVFDDIIWFDGRDGREISRQVMPEYDFEKVLERNAVHAGIMFPREAWRATGGYPKLFGQGREDWAFNVALGVKGWCGVHLNRPGYLYRRHGHNRTLVNTNPEARARFMAMMRQTFPGIYRGERPMGCCGGNRGGQRVLPVRSVEPTQPRRGVNRGAAAQTDVTLLKYVGGADGYEFWYGPVTQQQYMFGKARPTGYVFTKDVPGMLAFMERGRPIFAVERPVAVERSQPVAPAAAFIPAKAAVYEPVTGELAVLDFGPAWAAEPAAVPVEEVPAEEALVEAEEALVAVQPEAVPSTEPVSVAGPAVPELKPKRGRPPRKGK